MMCLGARAAREVLDGAADPAGQVEVGGDLGAGLADLLGVRPPALRGHHAGDPDHAAEQPASSSSGANPSALPTPRPPPTTTRAVASDAAARPGRRLDRAHRKIARRHRRRDVVDRDGGRCAAGTGDTASVATVSSATGASRTASSSSSPAQRCRTIAYAPPRVIHAVTVRRHRQPGDRAQVRQHLVAALGSRRDHGMAVKSGGARTPQGRTRRRDAGPRLRRVPVDAGDRVHLGDAVGGQVAASPGRLGDPLSADDGTAANTTAAGAADAACRDLGSQGQRRRSECPRRHRARRPVRPGRRPS